MANVSTVKSVKGSLSVSDGGSIQGVLSSTRSLSGEISRSSSGSSYDVYVGPYTVTPTRDTQTLDTNLKVTTSDITVNPIPNNYGLITWDGSVLTVS